MKILIAPNAMKGSLSAFDFADIVENAFLQYSHDFQVRKIPVADGGDCTGEVLARSFNAQQVFVEVVGPFGKSVQSQYSMAGKKAIIEMADASGMKLVSAHELNPMLASSYGTGQLIADAIDRGCDEVELAIGGSATVDGGMGMMEALGFRFFDENGDELHGNGGNLTKVKSIETPELPKLPIINIICDVDNPLLGENGAAAVFGPQKGADPEMVQQLEQGLSNWNALISAKTGKDISKVNGTGAAGGMAVPLVAFMAANMVPGATFVLEQLGLEESVQWADLVITGEGKIDSQTLNNKAPFAVAQVARKHNKTVIAIGGKVDMEASDAFDGIYSQVNGPMKLEEAMHNSATLLHNFASQYAKTLLSLKNTIAKS